MKTTLFPPGSPAAILSSVDIMRAAMGEFGSGGSGGVTDLKDQTMAPADAVRGPTGSMTDVRPCMDEEYGAPDMALDTATDFAEPNRFVASKEALA